MKPASKRGVKAENTKRAPSGSPEGANIMDGPHNAPASTDAAATSVDATTAGYPTSLRLDQSTLARVDRLVAPAISEAGRSRIPGVRPGSISRTSILRAAIELGLDQLEHRYADVAPPK